MSLQLLDLAFEVILVLLLLRRIIAIDDLVVDFLESFSPLCHLLEGLLDLLLQLSLRHGC